MPSSEAPLIQQVLLHSADSEVRAEALGITGSLDTPGLRDAWAGLMEDPDPDIQSSARWRRVETGDPRPCPALFRHAEEVARTWTGERSRDHRIRVVGSECAPTHCFDYFDWYKNAGDETSRALYKKMIDGATGIHLLDDPAILERLLPLADDSDELVSETARRVLRWQEEAQSKSKAEDIRGGLRPIVLVGFAVIAAVVGALFFAVAVLALIDQEMSAALAKSLAAVSNPESSLTQISSYLVR